MKKLFALPPLVVQPIFAQQPGDSKPDKGDRHELVIVNFRTESGTKLPQAGIVYGTYDRHLLRGSVLRGPAPLF